VWPPAVPVANVSCALSVSPLDGSTNTVYVPVAGKFDRFKVVADVVPLEASAVPSGAYTV
ncbi:hypothetical protein, partial [Xanthomonas oryzae]|uniref:hypothetical protein n=1 Tax=Xanthomonas oryzae TaxID=347 RepID=UPI001CA56115